MTKTLIEEIYLLKKAVSMLIKAQHADLETITALQKMDKELGHYLTLSFIPMGGYYKLVPDGCTYKRCHLANVTLPFAHVAGITAQGTVVANLGSTTVLESTEEAFLNEFKPIPKLF